MQEFSERKKFKGKYLEAMQKIQNRYHPFAYFFQFTPTENLFIPTERCIYLWVTSNLMLPSQLRFPMRIRRFLQKVMRYPSIIGFEHMELGDAPRSADREYPPFLSREYNFEIKLVFWISFELERVSLGQKTWNRRWRPRTQCFRGLQIKNVYCGTKWHR